ncbi:uncharacterized protein LOC132351012 [Balaenoptera ricei]|uniref:uncharacterized protein LOC132351012 n=1 Tax=Balaenoptera ricei TaxID=2746895 RepID=UPI0028BD3211|nr:uncharacterized protein LOC132351012 [Balaenoptera ricei]
MEGGQEPESEPEQGDPAWVHRLQVVKKCILAYACKESPTKREPRTLTWPLGCQEGNSDGQAINPSRSQEESVDEAPTPSVLPPGRGREGTVWMRFQLRRVAADRVAVQKRSQAIAANPTAARNGTADRLGAGRGRAAVAPHGARSPFYSGNRAGPREGTSWEVDGQGPGTRGSRLGSTPPRPPAPAPKAPWARSHPVILPDLALQPARGLAAAPASGNPSSAADGAD